MKQKTFMAYRPEELDELCNQFSTEKNVRASQMRVTLVKDEDGKEKVMFFETCWYEERTDVHAKSAVTPLDLGGDKKVWKVCVSCGKFVLTNKYKKCKCGSTNFKEPMEEERVY